MMQPPFQMRAHLAEVDVPLPVLGARADEVHALRVGANLRGVERVADGLNHLVAVAVELAALAGPLICLLASTRSSLRAERLRASTAASMVGMATPRSSAIGARPLARPLLPGLVEHEIDERLARLRVFDAQNLAR